MEFNPGIIKILGETKDIAGFINKNAKLFRTESIRDFLNRKISEKDLKVSEVGKKSAQSEYVYKIFNGTRKASRNVLLALGLGMELTLDEITELLKIAEFSALNPGNKRDAVFIHCFLNNKTVFEAKAILEEIKEDQI